MKKKILMVLFLMTVMSINATAVSTASPDVFSGDVSPKCTICVKAAGKKQYRSKRFVTASGVMQGMFPASMKVAEIGIRMKNKSDWFSIRLYAKNVESAIQNAK